MGLREWASSLLYGPGHGRVSSGLAQPVTIPHIPETRTSWVFDSHVVSGLSEAASGGKSKLPQAVSAAYDEYAWNVDNARSAQGMTHRERKETLLSIFLANPWASNCIDTIALYIISGGFTIEPRVEKPDEKQHDEIQQFLLRINEDWDFNQYVYDMLTDEMIFGEAFTEYTMQNGKPYQLFSIDCITMDTEHDRYGRTVRYKQQLDTTTEVNYLDKDSIIRWWNPHKRAKVDPFSPLERIQDAILLDKKMVNWMTTFFQKGAKFPYTVEFQGDKDEAERFLVWFKSQYTGEKNAHLPPVTYNGAKINPSGKGSIDIDFDNGLNRMQTIVLSAFHVPPSIACIAESGNRLTDMSDGQRKILQYIACDPRRHRFFEKFNYRLIQPYFGKDYYVSSRYADFRDDEALAKVADMRIRNGSLKINEVRQEMGREAYTKGGDVALFAVSKEVTPVERLDEMAGEQRQSSQLDLETKQAQLDKLKEPPPVMTPQGATPPEQPVQGKGKKPANKIATKSKTPTEGDTDNEESTSTQPTAHSQIDAHRALQPTWQNETPRIGTLSVVRPPIAEAGQDHSTGMMLAFMLDKDTAEKLAIPGGEKPEDLHITLAYLGDMEDDEPTDGTLRPDTSPFKIREAIAGVASEAKPLTGMVGGIGRFFPAETDKTPIIALVDVSGLAEFRTKLVTAVQAVGYKVADNHGYTPHITLDYIDASAPMPIKDMPALPLTLDTVTLCVGDKRYPFRLGDEQYPDYWDKQGQVKESATASVMTRAKLAEQVAAFFNTIIARGQHVRDIHTAFNFTHGDYEQLADFLATGYLSAKQAAYQKAIATAQPCCTVMHGWTPTDDMAALDWAREQVKSIASTYQQTVASLIEKLSNESSDEHASMEEGFPNLKALASGVTAGVKAFVAWKAPQIANVTVGTGSNDGTGLAIDGLRNGEGDPNGVRVRVIPAESSSDKCSEYAGNNYSLDEAVDLPEFPIHPNCPHEREVYLTEGVL